MNGRPTTESFLTVSQLIVPDPNHKKGVHSLKESSLESHEAAERLRSYNFNGSFNSVSNQRGGV
jgi:hypothetical protein